MQVLYTIRDVKNTLRPLSKRGKTIGLVPTMGYLHEGHASLIEEAGKECDIVVLSIFVNPTQFAPNEDFDSYPRNFERDIQIAEKHGVDYIFAPQPEEMYKSDEILVSVGKTLTQRLEGKTRPTHFDGVTTVVNKLFNIVMPDKAYFGQKDAQQVVIIKDMVNNLDMDVEIVVCPIVREDDGLAKSSRNVYLSAEERKSALILSKTLADVNKSIENGEKKSEILLREAENQISSTPHARLDYIKIVNPFTLEEITEIGNQYLILIAVWVGKTRLIDNYLKM